MSENFMEEAENNPRLSEKVKCPNPECENGSLYGDAHGIKFFRDYCPVCHGTGFAPDEDSVVIPPKSSRVVTAKVVSREKGKFITEEVAPALSDEEIRETLTDFDLFRLYFVREPVNTDELDRWSKTQTAIDLKYVASSQASLTASHYAEKIKELEEVIREWKAKVVEFDGYVSPVELQQAEQEMARKILEEISPMLWVVLSGVGEGSARMSKANYQYFKSLESKYGVSKSSGQG